MTVALSRQQMPCQAVASQAQIRQSSSDWRRACEWIDEIPPIPIEHSAKLQPRGPHVPNCAGFGFWRRRLQQFAFFKFSSCSIVARWFLDGSRWSLEATGGLLDGSSMVPRWFLDGPSKLRGGCSMAPRWLLDGSSMVPRSYGGIFEHFQVWDEAWPHRGFLA